MTNPVDSTSPWYSLQAANVMLLGLAAFKFLLHMLTSAFTEYGYFIDEFYYIACSKRLALGYVDHPPLSIWMLAANRWLLGDSLPALRFLPALAGAATVFVTGLIARRLGGGTMAQMLAALASLVAPIYLLLSGFYSMNPFELLIWTLCGYVLVEIFLNDKPKLWLAIGVLVGIGLEFKHTMVLYVVALVIGLLFTTARKYFFVRWFWIGWSMAFVLLLPNLIWQAYNGFPSIEFYQNAAIYKNIPTSPLGVLAGQVLLMNPIPVALAVIGLWYYLFSKEGKSCRTLGFSFIILLLIMFVARSSRPDRISAAYPVLFAAGALVVEKFAASHAKVWIAKTAAVLLIAGGLVIAPVVVPLLPPDTLIKYMSAIGFELNIERGKHAKLPQWLADRFGWKEMVAEVGRVYNSLPVPEKENAVILTNSYGQSGALEFFGPQYNLPRIISTHNNYFLWGPCSDSVQVYITVMVDRRQLEGKFEDIRQEGLHTCDLCMNYESYLPVYVARRPKFSIHDVWPLIKHFE